MGLDIIPLARPKPGHEAEFVTIFRLVHGRDDVRRTLLSRMFSAKRQLAAKRKRFNEISDPPFAVLGAPVVGRDVEADAWIREMAEVHGEPVDDAIARTRGYHVLQVLPEMDGLPVYSNGYLYEGVDGTSFRGELLKDCGEVLTDTLVAQAWEPMLADELAAWAHELSAAAHAYAARMSVEHVLGMRTVDVVDENDPASMAHIVDSVARWGVFWSTRGHGAEPYH